MDLTPEQLALIPRIVLVVNGPLMMGRGKIACQTFQAHERVTRALAGVEVADLDHRWTSTIAWREHTTTICRVATTPVMWERVLAELDGVLMVDEGFTEVEPDTPTVWCSWPHLPADTPELLLNKKIPLLDDKPLPYEIEAVARALCEEIAPDFSEAVWRRNEQAPPRESEAAASGADYGLTIVSELAFTLPRVRRLKRPPGWLVYLAGCVLTRSRGRPLLALGADADPARAGSRLPSKRSPSC